jgi:hypothetical protein
MVAMTPHVFAPVSLERVLDATAWGMSVSLLEPILTDEGNRHSNYMKLGGALCRRCVEIELISATVPDIKHRIPTLDAVEQYILFCAEFAGDDDPRDRVRVFKDTCRKYERGAKTTGLPKFIEVVGTETWEQLKLLFNPGTDTSPLLVLRDKHVYLSDTEQYVDLPEFYSGAARYIMSSSAAENDAAELTLAVGTSNKPAWPFYLRSKMRVKANFAEAHPNQPPGAILTIRNGEIIDEDTPGHKHRVFNSWRGFPIQPASPVNPRMMRVCTAYLDRMLGELTNNNPRRSTS